MNTCELLDVEPKDLEFPFELKKQISCSLQLLNKTDKYVAFKVKTTNPKKYCVRPNTGIVLPRSTCDVMVTMQAQKEGPVDMQCKDKFLVQSVVAKAGAAAKDVTAEMFNKESGHLVEDCRLKVLYVHPPRPPSPVREGSEEGSSPRASISDNVVSADFSNTASRGTVERPGRAEVAQDNHSSEVQASSLITKLTEEKNYAVQLSHKLQKELDLLRRDSNRSRGGIPLMYVIIVGLIGLILGYLLKKT